MSARLLASLVKVIAWAMLLFLTLPVFIVVPVSLTPQSWLSLPTTGLSLRHYAAIAATTEWLEPFETSFLVAGLVTCLATALGSAAAIAAWRLAHPLVRWLSGVILLPLIVPPVVSALALYRVWVDLGIFDTLLGTVLAHTIIATPFVFTTVGASLASLDPRIEQASRSLGASVMTTVVRVIVPCVRPGILAGAVFAFIASWDEVVITLFVTSRHVFTLPRKIFQDLRDTIDPTVAAVSSILVVVTLLVALLLFFTEERRKVPG
ncbi:MAG TPA: ABC transporter permease [Stellaceae bacterium]|nr:ABC transporter permease [Stellaceae bacterium]